jgi:mannitol-1-phosphate/altronate dehydrogenase
VQNLTHTAAGAAKDAEEARRRLGDADSERLDALAATQHALDSVKKAEQGREFAAQAQARAESERTIALGQAEKAAKERDGAMAAMRQMAGERDAVTETLKERDQWVDQLAAAVTEQRESLAVMIAERDAARSSAEQARKLIDELTGQLRTIMPDALAGSRDPRNGFPT